MLYHHVLTGQDTSLSTGNMRFRIVGREWSCQLKLLFPFQHNHRMVFRPTKKTKIPQAFSIGINFLLIHILLFSNKRHTAAPNGFQLSLNWYNFLYFTLYYNSCEIDLVHTTTYMLRHQGLQTRRTQDALYVHSKLSFSAIDWQLICHIFCCHRFTANCYF